MPHFFQGKAVHASDKENFGCVDPLELQKSEKKPHRKPKVKVESVSKEEKAPSSCKFDSASAATRRAIMNSSSDSVDSLVSMHKSTCHFLSFTICWDFIFALWRCLSNLQAPLSRKVSEFRVKKQKEFKENRRNLTRKIQEKVAQFKKENAAEINARKEARRKCSFKGPDSRGHPSHKCLRDKPCKLQFLLQK